MEDCLTRRRLASSWDNSPHCNPGLLSTQIGISLIKEQNITTVRRSVEHNDEPHCDTHLYIVEIRATFCEPRKNYSRTSHIGQNNIRKSKELYECSEMFQANSIYTEQRSTQGVITDDEPNEPKG